MVNGYDGSAATDFFDTLEILAIQPLDEHDQPIPGEYYTIPDVNGGPLVVDSTPPPTTTTLPGATTTTTTTIPAGATTTTTVLPAASTTTTTTLAPGCAAEVTTASVLCRIDALSMDAAADAGPLATKLEARLQKVRGAIVAADAGPVAKAKRVLRKAVKRIRASEPPLRSKKARHADPAPHPPVRHRVGRADAARGSERVTASVPPHPGSSRAVRKRSKIGRRRSSRS